MLPGTQVLIGSRHNCPRQSEQTLIGWSQHRHTAVNRLPGQINERQACIVRPKIGQAPFEEFAEAQPPAQLSRQNQTDFGSQARSLKRDTRKPVKREFSLSSSPTHPLCPPHEAPIEAKLHLIFDVGG